MIITGKLRPKDTKVNSNGNDRWIRGTIILPYKSLHILKELGQSKLTFNWTTGEILPIDTAIIIGELVESTFDNGRTWQNLQILRVLASDSSIWKTMGVTFKEACELVESEDTEFLDRLGAVRLFVRKQITDLLGTSNKFADTLLEHFDENAYNKLIENPWEMIHIVPYFTIEHADKVAEAVGLSIDDPRRFYAYFRCLLDQSFTQHRNTYISENEFQAFYWLHFSERLSIEQYNELAVTPESPIIKTEFGYAPTHLYVAEKASYNVLMATFGLHYPITEAETKATQTVIDESDIELTDEQIHALSSSFHHPLHIVTGGPGTGKTTILHAILRKLVLLTGVSPQDENSPYLLVAPTGKAASRMQEQTGVIAHTIHSAFGILPEYGCADVFASAKRLQHVRYIIIDEASMLDTKLFGDMCRVIEEMDHVPFLLLVGDVDQLPPVGHGQVFSDLLNHVEKHKPDYATRLTILKRQDEGSNIPELADMIKKGEFPDASWFADKPDVFYIPATMDTLNGLLTEKILKPKVDALDSIQLITPYRNGASEDTIHAINMLVGPIYNPVSENEPVARCAEPMRQFRAGDKVINKTNINKTIINGSIGYVTRVETSSPDIFHWAIYVDYDGEELGYLYADWKWLEPAYAITIHASQGSEYENVALPMLRGCSGMDFLTRNLLYVACTRASNKLVLMGQISTFKRIASTVQKPRLTALSQWLERGTK